ncbi:MAG TPA: hypothetical protein P5181_03755 [Dermatophilaceae bacterium]|nr:hypothetical protein [Dermatophilaceae bacterium]
MRKTLDKLISWTGLILAVVLLVAGGLLTWASNFVADNVKQQLADQHITMPAAAALTTQEMKDNLTQYAGQPMTTGDQAKAYADYYILEHMNASSGGKTYSEISGQALAAQKADPQMANPETKKLMDLRQSLFMGSTLRGLLLYAYAFGTMGKIAGFAAIVCFLGAGLLLVLALLGLRHAKQVAVAETPAKVTV